MPLGNKFLKGKEADDDFEIASDHEDEIAADLDEGASKKTVQESVDAIRKRIQVHGDVTRVFSPRLKALLREKQMLPPFERLLMSVLDGLGPYMGVQLANCMKEGGVDYWLCQWGYTYETINGKVRVIIPGARCGRPTDVQFDFDSQDLGGLTRLTLVTLTCAALDKDIELGDDEFTECYAEQFDNVKVIYADGKLSVTFSGVPVNVLLAVNEVVNGELTSDAVLRIKTQAITQAHSQVIDEAIQYCKRLPNLIPLTVTITKANRLEAFMSAATSAQTLLLEGQTYRALRENKPTFGDLSKRFIDLRPYAQKSSEYKWYWMFMGALDDWTTATRWLMVGAGKRADFVNTILHFNPKATIDLCDVENVGFQSTDRVTFHSGEEGDILNSHIETVLAPHAVLDVSVGGKLGDATRLYYVPNEENMRLFFRGCELAMKAITGPVKLKKWWIKMPLGMDDDGISALKHFIRNFAINSVNVSFQKVRGHNCEAWMVLKSVVTTSNSQKDELITEAFKSFVALVATWRQGLSIRHRAFTLGVIPNVKFTKFDRERVVPYMAKHERMWCSTVDPNAKYPDPNEPEEPNRDGEGIGDDLDDEDVVKHRSDPAYRNYGEDEEEDEDEGPSTRETRPRPREVTYHAAPTVSVTGGSKKERSAGPQELDLKTFQTAFKNVEDYKTTEADGIIGEDRQTSEVKERLKSSGVAGRLGLIIACVAALGSSRCNPGSCVLADVWPTVQPALAAVPGFLGLKPKLQALVFRRQVLGFTGFESYYSSTGGVMINVDAMAYQVPAKLKEMACFHMPQWLFKYANLRTAVAKAAIRAIRHLVYDEADTEDGKAPPLICADYRSFIRELRDMIAAQHSLITGKETSPKELGVGEFRFKQPGSTTSGLRFK